MRHPGWEHCYTSLDLRLLLVNVQLQENEMDKMGLAKHWKIRDCYVHIFTETCPHRNIPDQDVALDGWNHVLELRTPAV